MNNIKSVEELIKPRYLVIADYPESIQAVGAILIRPTEEECKENQWLKAVQKKIDELSRYPHLFRKLEWWEFREEGEMPVYVHVIKKVSLIRKKDIPFYAKVDTIINGRPLLLFNKLSDGTDGLWCDWSCLIPATESDYTAYLKTIKV